MPLVFPAHVKALGVSFVVDFCYLEKEVGEIKLREFNPITKIFSLQQIKKKSDVCSWCSFGLLKCWSCESQGETNIIQPLFVHANKLDLEMIYQCTPLKLHVNTPNDDFKLSNMAILGIYICSISRG